MNAFFKLSKQLQQGIAHTLGWESLRPVQELTIQAVLEGKNCIVLAPTAGGKTEAAFFPILDTVSRKKLMPISTLYISPLRALLNNQETRIQSLTGLVGLTSFKWHGDVQNSLRKRFLAEPTDVLMITPESLEVILTQSSINKEILFRGLRYAVIDEIHAFAAGDRGAHLASVMERLQNYSLYDIQRIGLSATVGDPENILAWQQGSSVRPGIVIDPPRSPKQRLIEIDVFDDEAMLAQKAARIAYGKKSIFFVESRRNAELVHQVMENAGLNTFVHHSSLSRQIREEVETEFLHGTNNCIVSTSTMELGIDIGDLDLVIQQDAPTTVSAFMQRLGRTGRREGTHPHIVFLVGEEMSLIRAIALVKLAQSGWIEPINPSRRAYHILVHQILAQALQYHGASQDSIWNTVKSAIPFSEISRSEYERQIDYLLQKDFLFSTSGLLVLGDETEIKFGRKNFLELYSVFETPEEMQVVTIDGQHIGMLQTWFVESLGQKEFVFVLAGRRWKSVDISSEDKTIVVKPAPQGVLPRWLGNSILLNREVTEACREVIFSNKKYPFLHPYAKKKLAKVRRDWQGILSHERTPIIQSGNKFEIFTFAGGRINSLLSLSLGKLLNTKVSNDNFSIIVESSTQHHIEESNIWAAFQKITHPDFYSQENLIDFAQNMRLNGLSKFQPLLPPEQEAKFIIDRLFDPKGTQDLLSQLDIDNSFKAIVNVGFSEYFDQTKILDSNTPLICDQKYFLWIEFINPLPHFLRKTNTTRNTKLSGVKLNIALFEFKNEISVLSEADIGEITLYSDGTSRVSNSSLSSDRLISDIDNLNGKLYLPIMTPKKEGKFHLRCNIYYRQVLLQSYLIEAQVMREQLTINQSSRSKLDYKLIQSYSTEKLAKLGSNKLCLMLNSNGVGNTHELRFYGFDNFKSDASFDGQELQDFIQQTRNQLRIASWGDTNPWTNSKEYKYILPDRNNLKDDLINFAISGYKFYDMIINRFTGGVIQSRKLADIMREPGNIQLALQQTSRYILPISMIYDHPLDLGYRDIELCSEFVNSLEKSTPLLETDCFRGLCPNYGNVHVVCPSGFWGFRHAIGLPLSMSGQQEIVMDILYQKNIEMIVGVATDLNKDIREAHEKAISIIHPELFLSRGDTRKILIDLLVNNRPHLVYFYCHSGFVDDQPVIRVGHTDESFISRSNLRALRIQWFDTNPLVFINSCSSTAVEPEHAIDFVSGFIENSGASGVLGTEITVFDIFASQFAEKFFSYFLISQSLGESIRRARLSCLEDGNPLGLVYIPFGLTSLKLRKQS